MPAFQEIADHFGFRSLTTVADHLRLIKQKGFIDSQPGRARSLRLVSPYDEWRSPTVEIPLFGSIPAGIGEEKFQEPDSCITVDIHTLGIKPTARTFALRVQGDSMIGKHIMDGDFVVLEHGRTPRSGDVVAALVDNTSTLKTYWVQQGKPFLKAENPKYKNIIPAKELLIQGVMLALIRRCP